MGEKKWLIAKKQWKIRKHTQIKSNIETKITCIPIPFRIIDRIQSVSIELTEAEMAQLHLEGEEPNLISADGFVWVFKIIYQQ